MAKQGQIVSKRPQAYLVVSLGSFLAYDIELVLNSFLLSHSSQILSKVYTLSFSNFNHCTTRHSKLRESYQKMLFRIVPQKTEIEPKNST